MKIEIDSKLDLLSIIEITKKRGLGTGGRVQRYVATNLLRVFDAYTPLRSGTLKGSATRNLSPPYTELVYDTPYAKKMFYNPQYNFNGSPMRGAYWSSRSWADNKDTFLSDLQMYLDKGAG